MTSPNKEQVFAGKLTIEFNNSGGSEIGLKVLQSDMKNYAIIRIEHGDRMTIFPGHGEKPIFDGPYDHTLATPSTTDPFMWCSWFANENPAIIRKSLTLPSSEPRSSSPRSSSE